MNSNKAIRPRRIYCAIMFAASIVLFASMAPAAEQAQQKQEPRKKMAILTFASGKQDEESARIARNAVELALFRTGLFDILEKEHIGLIINERKKQMEQCRDSDCAVAIGELLSAGYVVIGSVDRGNDYVVQTRVVDVEKKRVVIVETAEASDSGKIREAAESLSRSISRRMERLGKKSAPASFSASFNFVTPVDYLARKVGFGFGFTLSCVAEDVAVKGLQAGGSVRFIYFTGKEHESHHAMMVPFNALVGYRFALRDFSINPVVGFGGSYDIIYYYRTKESSKYSAGSAVQPLLLVGLDLTYSFTPMFQIQLKPEYAVIFERDGVIQFFSAGIGVGILF